MTSRYLRISSLKFYVLLIGAAGLVLAYALPALKELAARSAYQRFIGMTAGKTGETMTETQLDNAAAMLERAARYERGNPRWRAERGNFLHRAAAASQDPTVIAQRSERFQQAESVLKDAVLRDPANGWNYYELGRLAISQGNCSITEGKLNTECQKGNAFDAAVRFAPNSVFLRTMIGAWYYEHNQNMALRLITDMLNESPQHARSVLDMLWPIFQDANVLRAFLPQTTDIGMTFARFLYDQRLDYASDVERRRALPDEHAIDCASQEQFREKNGETELEIGNDDGTAEWRSYLALDEERIKKELCVPDDIAAYREASLKIFMSSAYPGDCTVLISIDETLIRQFVPRELPYENSWIDIPFPPIVLYGKQRISVYVRTLQASVADGNYVNVWGDNSVPTTNSVFAFDHVDDLSHGQNVQGEYMIRLILKKSAKRPLVEGAIK